MQIVLKIAKKIKIKLAQKWETKKCKTQKWAKLFQLDAKCFENSNENWNEIGVKMRTKVYSFVRHKTC